MYPRYGPAGGGLLRLHSTYRHDLKIYSSDEGRVQMSAAAFTQASQFQACPSPHEMYVGQTALRFAQPCRSAIHTFC